MADDPFDLDERFALNIEPEEALEIVLAGEGVDVEMDPEEPESKS